MLVGRALACFDVRQRVLQEFLQVIEGDSGLFERLGVDFAPQILAQRLRGGLARRYQIALALATDAGIERRGLRIAGCRRTRPARLRGAGARLRLSAARLTAPCRRRVLAAAGLRRARVARSAAALRGVALARAGTGAAAVAFSAPGALSAAGSSATAPPAAPRMPRAAVVSASASAAGAACGLKTGLSGAIAFA